MLNHTRRITKCLAVLVLAGPLATEGRGDFILWNDEQLTVNMGHNTGTLYDQSQVHVVSGGDVDTLRAYNSSTVNISSDGKVSNKLYAYDSSTVNISGGGIMSPVRVTYLYAYGSSTVNVSGGSVDNLLADNSSTVEFAGGKLWDTLYAWGSSTVDLCGGTVQYVQARSSRPTDISGGSVHGLSVYGVANVSGGSVNYLDAWQSGVVNVSGGSVNSLGARESSVVTINARVFHLGPGLSLDGDRVLGTGILGGVWFDGTPWAVTIRDNASGAAIWAIPEPACRRPSMDLDEDCDVDGDDLLLFASCMSGPAVPHDGTGLCQIADADHDDDVDQSDFGVFQRCLSGAGIPADPDCED